MSADPLLLGMAPRRIAPPAPRSAVIAGLLALVCDGLGHFYCGRVGAAVVWALLPVVLWPGLMAIGVFVPSLLHVLAMGAAAGAFVLRLVQTVLAVRLARGLPAYALKPLNNAGLYFGFFLVAWAAGNVIARPMRALVIEPFKVPSGSMEPSVITGDQVFVLKVGPHSKIRRGDVIVYESGDGHSLIKRVVGLPGDTRAMDGQTLTVNGVLLPAVPPGHYFVLGDNRDNSVDSRESGPVPFAQVTGRAAAIWLSLDEHWRVRWNRLGLQL